MTTQKLPTPGEYWRSRSGEIRLIACDVRQHDSGWSGPYPIISINKSGGIATHDASGRDYNDTDESPNDLIEHLSDCTGFDWKPPAPIDPGEGWELLPVGTVLQDGDEFYAVHKWLQTSQVGDNTAKPGLRAVTYRRRKPPAETWPKWYVRTSGADSWVYRADGRYTIRNLTCDCVADPAEWYWRHGNMVEITESEALARVKPAEPISADRIPGDKPVYVTACETCGIGHHLPSGKCDHCNSERIAQSVERTATPLVPAVVESPDDWVEITESHPGHIRRACDEVCWKGDDSPIWIPVQSSIGMPQSEWEFTRIRCRRRDLPALPAPLPTLIPGVATDRMVDLFLSWRLPSDFQPDGGISFTSRPIHESWPTGTNLFTASQARKMIEHLLSVPEETSPPAVLQPKRTPVRLWVSHRIILERGDWPMRCTPADEEFDDGGRSVWKEIKFDGSGFYVEG